MVKGHGSGRRVINRHHPCRIIAVRASADEAQRVLSSHAAKCHNVWRMTERLPPLNALRAFEAAARRLSFTEAAEELCVSAAAVSHQIRSLEDYLGTELFHRANRSLALTDAGMVLLPEIREAFARLNSATKGLRRHESAGPVTVALSPSFAAKWLVPRLPRFRKLWPDIEVKVAVSSGLVNFGQEDVDLAIRYGGGNYPGLHSELLMKTEFFPVCSPALMKKGVPSLRTPDDLSQFVLLHDDPVYLPTQPNWQTWLQAAGVTGVDAKSGPHFNNSFLSLEMAIAGNGVALALSPLVAGDLAEGRLIRPFDLSLPNAFSFFFVCPAGCLRKQKVKTFRAWLLEETDDMVAPGR